MPELCVAAAAAAAAGAGVAGVFANPARGVKEDAAVRNKAIYLIPGVLHPGRYSTNCEESRVGRHLDGRHRRPEGTLEALPAVFRAPLAESASRAPHCRQPELIWRPQPWPTERPIVRRS